VAVKFLEVVLTQEAQLVNVVVQVAQGKVHFVHILLISIVFSVQAQLGGALKDENAHEVQFDDDPEQVRQTSSH
jgi:hypothetical protein